MTAIDAKPFSRGTTCFSMKSIHGYPFHWYRLLLSAGTSDALNALDDLEAGDEDDTSRGYDRLADISRVLGTDVAKDDEVEEKSHSLRNSKYK